MIDMWNLGFSMPVLSKVSWWATNHHSKAGGHNVTLEECSSLLVYELGGFRSVRSCLDSTWMVGSTHTILGQTYSEALTEVGKILVDVSFRDPQNSALPLAVQPKSRDSQSQRPRRRSYRAPFVAVSSPSPHWPSWHPKSSSVVQTGTSLLRSPARGGALCNPLHGWASHEEG
eukprot:3911755-Amphidinium_carterae.1